MKQKKPSRQENACRRLSFVTPVRRSDLTEAELLFAEQHSDSNIP